MHQGPGKSVYRALAFIRPTSGIDDAVEIRFCWELRGDAQSYFQATLKCEPRRTSAPGTCS